LAASAHHIIIFLICEICGQEKGVFAVEQQRIELTNGTKRAVFVRTEQGWAPDWFYQNDRAMLRFKDHEWLSIGHVHPSFAAEAEQKGKTATFRGTSMYGSVSVPWAIKVSADKLGGGFVVECAFTPAGNLELLEAYSTFETPYEYDGTEHATTVIGQNPIAVWHGAKEVSPPQ